MTNPYNTQPHKVLIIDDEAEITEMLTQILNDNHYLPLIANSSQSAIGLAKKNKPIHIALVDCFIPDIPGPKLIHYLKEQSPYIEIIAMTAVGRKEDVANIMKHGASNYLSKPFDINELLFLITQSILTSIENERIDHIRQELIFSHSPDFKKIEEQIEHWSRHNVTILLTGESGTGKGLIAELIHKLSPRNAGPFVVVNCGGITESLLESELFGYVEGAFTGALKGGRPGKLETAKDGTIFLDEVEALSPNAQVALLHFLQHKTITPVGGTRPKKIDARILCATNKDLKAMTKENKFRDDLYHRIGKFLINLLPLRERKEDIPLLVEYFIKKSSLEHNLKSKKITPNALDILIYCQWEGNIRELESTIEYCVLNAKGDIINPEALPDDIRQNTQIPTPNPSLQQASYLHNLQMQDKTKEKINAGETISLKDNVNEYEKSLIIEYLKKNNGNIPTAAKQLSLPYWTLRDKIEKFNLKDLDYKNP